MKKIVSFFISLSLLFLIVCVFWTVGYKEKIEEGPFEIYGSYRFYETSAGNFWKESKKGRVCFDFEKSVCQKQKQKDYCLIFNKNNQYFRELKHRKEFCFTNTEEAKKLLNIPEGGKRGKVTCIVKNMTDRDVPIKKSNPCLKEGTCLFNEAELVEVLDLETQTERKKRFDKLREDLKREEEVGEELDNNLKIS